MYRKTKMDGLHSRETEEIVNTGRKTSHIYPTIIICVNHVDPMDLENSCCFIHQYKTVLNKKKKQSDFEML